MQASQWCFVGWVSPPAGQFDEPTGIFLVSAGLASSSGEELDAAGTGRPYRSETITRRRCRRAFRYQCCLGSGMIRLFVWNYEFELKETIQTPTAARWPATLSLYPGATIWVQHCLDVLGRRDIETELDQGAEAVHERGIFHRLAMARRVLPAMTAHLANAIVGSFLCSGQLRLGPVGQASTSYQCSGTLGIQSSSRTADLSPV